MKRKILIIGSGISGMRAAYDLASLGMDVVLAEPKTFTGGTLMQLDEQFPTDACGICRMQPRVSGDKFAEFCPRKDFLFPNVNVWRDTQVIGVTQSNTNKKVIKFRRKGSRVDDMLCIGCGRCSDVCHTEIPDEFNAGLFKRKAIDRASMHSITSLYSIDETMCDRCGECLKVCPTNAILIGEDEIFEDEFDAVLLTPGFEEFSPVQLSEYGYGRFKNVLTSIELERMYSKANVTSSEFVTSYGTTPKRIAFVQCVGSRTEERPYCSSACCMYAMKEARHIKKILPDALVKIFFMDVRAFGKDYYRYALGTEAKDIEFVQCRVPKIYQDENSRSLKIVYEDEDGNRAREEFDMVVLSVGQVVADVVRSLIRSFGVEVDEWGFVKLVRPGSFETNVENVFAAGSITGPKDIAESVCESSSASAEICEKLGVPQKFEPVLWKGNPVQKKSVAVILCRCAGVISDNLALEHIAEKIKVKKNVSDVVFVNALCTKFGLDELARMLEMKDYGTLIIGACQSNAYLARYSRVAQAVSQNPPDIRVVDIRNVVWQIAPERRDELAATLIFMEVADATHSRERSFVFDVPRLKRTTKKAIVIGGGPAGLSSALMLASVGVPVILIEKSESLGGAIKNSSGRIGEANNKAFVESLITKVQELKVEVLTSTKIREITGGVGNFSVWIEDKQGDLVSLDAGVIIVATGAVEHKLQYNSPRVVLWNEFENLIESRAPNEVVFIQCADARDQNRPWCNRICCVKTMELIDSLKKKNPNARIWVLYRDMMTYGHYELSYREVREHGVLFVRYSLDRKPSISTEDETPVVSVFDSILGMEIEIRPEYVVLQSGVDPVGDEVLDKYLPKTLGFWDSLDPKFSVHETRKAGVFVAGSGRMPMRAIEAVIDGRASAMESLKYLIIDELPNRGKIAYVRERFCTGCQYCISACPYDARVFDDAKNKVYVIPEQCMSCGSCAVACPSEATVMLGEDRNSMLAKILEAVK